MTQERRQYSLTSLLHRPCLRRLCSRLASLSPWCQIPRVHFIKRIPALQTAQESGLHIALASPRSSTVSLSPRNPGLAPHQENHSRQNAQSDPLLSSRPRREEHRTLFPRLKSQVRLASVCANTPSLIIEADSQSNDIQVALNDRSDPAEAQAQYGWAVLYENHRG